MLLLKIYLQIQTLILLKVHAKSLHTITSTVDFISKKTQRKSELAKEQTKLCNF